MWSGQANCAKTAQNLAEKRKQKISDFTDRKINTTVDSHPLQRRHKKKDGMWGGGTSNQNFCRSWPIYLLPDLDMFCNHNLLSM